MRAAGSSSRRTRSTDASHAVQGAGHPPVVRGRFAETPRDPPGSRLRGHPKHAGPALSEQELLESIGRFRRDHRRARGHHPRRRQQGREAEGDQQARRRGRQHRPPRGRGEKDRRDQHSRGQFACRRRPDDRPHALDCQADPPQRPDRGAGREEGRRWGGSSTARCSASSDSAASAWRSQRGQGDSGWTSCTPTPFESPRRKAHRGRPSRRSTTLVDAIRFRLPAPPPDPADGEVLWNGSHCTG